MLVKDLMTTAVTSVTPGSPAAAAVKIMRSEDVGIVPVCDIQGHLLGEITERAVRRRAGQKCRRSYELQCGLYCSKGKHP